MFPYCHAFSPVMQDVSIKSIEFHWNNNSRDTHIYIIHTCIYCEHTYVTLYTVDTSIITSKLFEQLYIFNLVDVEETGSI